MAGSSTTLTGLVEQAASGDPTATKDMLRYLSASNADIRHMMQAAIHEANHESLWRQILHCIGHSCWLESGTLDLAETTPATRQAGGKRKEKSSTGEQSALSSRLIQSLVEVFILDTGPSLEEESETKQGILLAALNDPDLLTHWAAGYLLGLRGHARAVPVLDEITGDPCLDRADLSKQVCIDWQMRAIEALAALNDVTCGPPLIKALASPDRKVHHAAGLAISELGIRAEPALLNALHHPDAHVRWHAARGLGQIGDLRAIDTLVEGLYDDNAEVRWTTARVLANLDCPAIPAILKVLCTQIVTEPLRQSAYHALNSMACQSRAEIHAYLKPLLNVLHEASAVTLISVDTPSIAQRLLADWKNVSPICEPAPAHREERRGF